LAFWKRLTAVAAWHALAAMEPLAMDECAMLQIVVDVFARHSVRAHTRSVAGCMERIEDGDALPIALAGAGGRRPLAA
jgi:hypothetical protein